MELVPTRVQLNRPLPPLTYLAPEGLPVGVRVRVKVRNSLAVGLAMGLDLAPPAAKLRPIEAVLDPFPLLPAKLRELQAFAARYYGCLEAHLLPLSLPPSVLPHWEADEDGQRLSIHRDRGAWAVLADLGEAWHHEPAILPTLLHRPALRGAGFTEVRLTGAPHPPRVSPAQAKVLLLLEEAGGALMEPELLASAGVGASVLGTLEKRGLVARMKRVDLLSQHREIGADRSVVLSGEQREAVEAVALGTFGVHLLQGVTGSGKTEVYLALAERVLAAGRRVLWLVPEVGLTARLLDRLDARFPGRIAVGHAGLNAGEKQGDVVRLLFNGADLFVGVRNAVLAPLRDIGLIIVDEEHEGSYKSEEHPRIHARDLAIKRAQIEGCPVLLGSATPSLESWQAAKSGKYQLLRLRERPVGVSLPRVEIVDLRDAYRQVRRKVILAPPLMQALTETLARGEQALLLLNRRGYENFWMCRACGKTLGCPHCAISLTYHRGDYRLRCHLCGHETVPPEACPDCGADHLRGVGEGTEQVEEHLNQLFPGARILRLDRDTTRRRGSFEAGLLAAESGEVDILVGTQMLAKGHTFPGLTLVGVINADQGLKVADFRASERTFQLLTQVAGRAGRADKAGRVILQTYSPEHPAIVHALAQDFEGFAASELPFREGLGYPPFTALTLYRAEADTAREAREALDAFRQRLAVPGLRVLGPLEAPVPRIRDQWRLHLLLKGSRGALSEVLARHPLDPAGPISLDRDPIQFG
ncbi:MAG: primosomal protein N' [Holophagaceae bacterium]|uniref:Replication restart protein PriA n=1 Tax=Candidatus Geothrix skivensis TaxID=2954439 RepID=A0A9D7SF43_9BACT|nr:primosomal protein N' [Candidatus Geothrix skivensis]